MTEYVKFTEINEHEGETWTFWLQVDANEPDLDSLAEQLAEADEDDEQEYALDLSTRLQERDVDVLVKHGGGGYMAFHTKVTGAACVPSRLDLHTLYKGGVRKLFEATS